MLGDAWGSGGRSSLPAPDAGGSGLPPAVVLYGPVVVSLVVQVPATIVIAAWTRVPVWSGTIDVLLAVASALCLLGARRFPGPVVVAASALTLASLFLPPGFGPPALALGFAIVGAVVRGARVWALAAVGAGWTMALLLGPAAGLQWHPFRIAAATVALLVCFAIGEGLRTRLDQASSRRARARLRIASAEQAERTRIARELHDVLAHSLSQISVQSGVALHLFDREPDRAREALAHIRSLSGAGLDEVRGVLGFLRGEDTAPVTPQPQLDDLPALARSRSGLGLTVDVAGIPLTPTPSSASQTTAYRIVQEALTNVVRHSGAVHATVTLARSGEDLRITVDDDGAGFSSDAPSGGGLRGMRERAELAGGGLDVGRSPLGGVQISATIPAEQTR